MTNCKSKINLFLHITGKTNNYHNLQSLVAFADYGDLISIEENSLNKIVLNYDGPFCNNLPKPESNLVYKVILFFYKHYNTSLSLTVNLTKNLPVCSGIGGGSMNASHVIKYLNKHFDLNLSNQKLKEIGLNFGADLPVCLLNETCVMEGIGEKITPINTSKISLHCLLVNPMIPISTQECFSNYNQDHCNLINHEDIIEACYSKQNLTTFLLGKTSNSLLNPALVMCPNILYILNKFKDTNSSFYQMSGSGATCFGVYDSEESLNHAYNKFKDSFPTFWVVKTKLIV